MTKSLHGDASFSVRGFKGTYTIKIKQNGQVINSETFTLGDNGQSLKINVGMFLFSSLILQYLSYSIAITMCPSIDGLI